VKVSFELGDGAAASVNQAATPTEHTDGVTSSPSHEKGDNAWVRIQEYEQDARIHKHGPLRKAIPVMSLPWASLCCLLNIVVPGSGRLAAVSVQGHPNTGLQARSYRLCIVCTATKPNTTIDSRRAHSTSPVHCSQTIVETGIFIKKTK
jgi:hypothetical protein